MTAMSDSFPAASGMFSAEHELSTEHEPRTAPSENAAGLADAEALVARAEADETAAHDARQRFRDDPMAPVAPNEAIAPHLVPGEELFAIRSSAIINGPGVAAPLTGYGGTLYLTSQRIVHLGQVTLSLRLEDIEELSLAGERLLLTLRGGDGIAVDVAGPRLLRAQIAAAMAALRP